MKTDRKRFAGSGAATVVCAGLLFGIGTADTGRGQEPTPPPVPAVTPPAAVASTNVTPAAPKAPPRRLKYKDADVDFVLQEYAELTGRTLLPAPGIAKPKITLQSREEMDVEHYLQAIEIVLGMNNIALVKTGDRFLQVVPIAQARQEGMAIREDAAGAALRDSGELVSQMIQLKHIDVSEATAVVQPLRHAAYGQIHPIERANSILVTDTSMNINRIHQLLKIVDQPREALEEPHIIQVRHAKAADIKRKLEEIIAESQKEQKKSTVPRPSPVGRPGVVSAIPTPPGVIRAPIQPVPVHPETAADILEQVERGLIRGEVKIVADDRTNILLIITRPENMAFFNKIINVLDVPTEPDVVVKIFRLEYAEAETVASTLNALIGAVSKEKDAKTSAAPAPGGDAESRSAALRDYVEQLRGQPKAGEPGKSKVGELSAANIKILSDKRTNSLIIMAAKSDLLTLEEIITNMDMMLLQVLVEAVVIQVELDKEEASGMHWVQRALVVNDQNSKGEKKTLGTVAGSAGGGAGTEVLPTMSSASSLTSLGSWGNNAGLTAYFTHSGLGLDAIVRMVATDSRSQILTAPIIVTTDNTKAKISSSEQRYFLKGMVTGADSTIVRPDVETRDIGLDLEVTPHINEKKNVVMEIAQQVSDPGPEQAIEGQGTWPTMKKRNLSATVSVRDRETVVLGGLVRNYKKKETSKVPLLGSIPLLGKLFSSKSESDTRGEVVVFITPYVFDSPEVASAESRRRKESLNVQGLWKKGWSGSDLAEGKDVPKDKENEWMTQLDRREKALKEKEAALARKEKELSEKGSQPAVPAPTNAVDAPPAP